MIHPLAIGWIQGKFRFCGQGESTVDSFWEIYDFVRASGWVAIVSWRNVFCKHSVWISTTHFWDEPQTPEAAQMLQFSQFRAVFIDRLVNSVLSGTAPLQRNTQSSHSSDSQGKLPVPISGAASKLYLWQRTE